MKKKRVEYTSKEYVPRAEQSLFIGYDTQIDEITGEKGIVTCINAPYPWYYDKSSGSMKLKPGMNNVLRKMEEFKASHENTKEKKEQLYI